MNQYDKVDPEEIISELKRLIELFQVKNKNLINDEKNISDPLKN